MKREKYVILRDENRYIDALILVQNWDDKFTPTVQTLADEWKETEDVEFLDFVNRGLKEKGYDFDVLDYEIVTAE